MPQRPKKPVSDKKRKTPKLNQWNADPTKIKHTIIGMPSEKHFRTLAELGLSKKKAIELTHSANDAIELELTKRDITLKDIQVIQTRFKKEEITRRKILDTIMDAERIYNYYYKKNHEKMKTKKGNTIEILRKTLSKQQKIGLSTIILEFKIAGLKEHEVTIATTTVIQSMIAGFKGTDISNLMKILIKNVKGKKNLFEDLKNLE